MILIVSSSNQERAALSAMCGSQGRVVMACHSVRATARLIRRCAPRTIVLRHRLDDGYSDHVLAQLAASDRCGTFHCVVLMAAGTPAEAEVRQVNLGADCVLRDPVRAEVLLAYIRKFQNSAAERAPAPRAAPAPLPFAGGLLHAIDRRLQHDHRYVALTPREVDLIETLLRDAGQVVSYEALYSDILNRNFAGETANMRVLLDKTCRAAASVGIRLRNWIEVIPKAGYRYHPAGRPEAPPVEPRPARAQPRGRTARPAT